MVRQGVVEPCQGVECNQGIATDDFLQGNMCATGCPQRPFVYSGKNWGVFGSNTSLKHFDKHFGTHLS